MDRVDPDKDDAERDNLLDELDTAWEALSPEEEEQVRPYSSYLKSIWTPQEKLREAESVLKWPGWDDPKMFGGVTAEEQAKRKQYWLDKKAEAELACTFPTPDDLFGMGTPWDGDKAEAPTGQSYWKFLIFKYKDKHTYVLENHILEKGDGHIMRSVVKRLL